MKQWRKDNRKEVMITDVEGIVPKDHLLRKIERVMEIVLVLHLPENVLEFFKQQGLLRFLKPPSRGIEAPIAGKVFSPGEHISAFERKLSLPRHISVRCIRRSA